jgi:GNAT superfamily N-acetyltransferase
MLPDYKNSFAIQEVTDPYSEYLPGMNAWLEQIFPEYCPARFGRLLTKLRQVDGKDQIQIFIGIIENQVVGLAQLFYREWQGSLLADLDLLGVLEPFRGSGIALALLQRSLKATHEMAQRYEIPALGLTTLIDPHYSPIVRLHNKLAGQIRTDYQYPSGDIIVWYPLQPGFGQIATPRLGEQFQQFGKLLEDQSEVF